MKNKERNLNRFIGNILISSFEKAWDSKDILNEYLPLKQGLRQIVI